MDGNMTYNEIVAAAEYSEARMHFNNDLHGKAEWTQTLAEQMQVIMEKVTEPAIINATFVVVDEDDGPSDEALVPSSCACPECGEMRMDCLVNDNDCITCLTCGGIYSISPEAQLERADWGDEEQDNWSDRYALEHPGALM